MEFNDGSMYRVVTRPAAQLAERQVYMHRAASARGGVPYVDPTFASHRAALATMPLLVYYQFVYTNAGTPEAQAEFFCNAIGSLRPNEAVMVDPESGGGFTATMVQEWVRRWLAVVEPRLKCRAWVYVPSALSAGLPRTFTDTRVVMAPRYSGTATRGAAPWWPHDVHQYTDQGHFPGCAQAGDTNYTALSVATLAARSRPKEEPTVPYSYNGWSAGPGWSIKGGQLQALVVAGESFAPGVRKGDAGNVLGYVANQIHKRVEPVVKAGWHQADDWGYAYRANVNNPNTLSCHASGTAIDYNATQHPNGKGGTWSAAEKAKILAILAEVNNTVRCLWGYDEMHFEICKNAAAVATAWRKVTAKPLPPPPGDVAIANDGILQQGDKGEPVRVLQDILNKWYPSLPQLSEDGIFGAGTKARVAHFQKAAGLTADGIAGPITLRALGLGHLR